MDGAVIALIAICVFYVFLLISSSLSAIISVISSPSTGTASGAPSTGAASGAPSTGTASTGAVIPPMNLSSIGQQSLGATSQTVTVPGEINNTQPLVFTSPFTNITGITVNYTASDQNWGNKVEVTLKSNGVGIDTWFVGRPWANYSHVVKIPDGKITASGPFSLVVPALYQGMTVLIKNINVVFTGN